ncbi:MAG TPA: hypothetical protein VEA38_00950 [Terriglobales bacterium]|nr:hypothetical protein [Terriglobales bacterium]
MSTAWCDVLECGATTAHVHCPSCAAANPGAALCPHHVMKEDEWATLNRAYCDFFHRGVALPFVAGEPEASVYDGAF